MIVNGVLFQMIKIKILLEKDLKLLKKQMDYQMLKKQMDYQMLKNHGLKILK